MITLNKTQDRHLEAVKWLFSEGNCASGRTFLMAYVFLIQACEHLGKWVYISDHSHAGGRQIVERIAELHDKEFSNNYDLSLSPPMCDIGRHMIKLTYKSRKQS